VLDVGRGMANVKVLKVVQKFIVSKKMLSEDIKSLEILDVPLRRACSDEISWSFPIQSPP
jgi:hypothetical protein